MKPKSKKPKKPSWKQIYNENYDLKALEKELYGSSVKKFKG